MFKKIKRSLNRLYIWFDYEILLFVLAFLPLKLGRYLAKQRGVLYFHKKRDWRSFTFGDHGLWDRVYSSYKELFPDYNDAQLIELVKQRYIYQSYEEYESALNILGKFRRLQVEYEGFENIKPYVDERKSIIFASGHFGSLYGFLFFDFMTNPMYAMTADIRKDPRVPKSIIKFMLKKYKGFEKNMNGGEFLPFDGNRKKFIKALKNGSNAIIIVDLPANGINEKPFWTDFLGEKRAMASGFHKIAQTTDSVIIPYVTYFENGIYKVKFGKSSQEAHQFLTGHIMKNPQMWWAADLLQSYKKEDKIEI